jgi:hypothetical protein
MSPASAVPGFLFSGVLSTFHGVSNMAKTMDEIAKSGGEESPANLTEAAPAAPTVKKKAAIVPPPPVTDAHASTDTVKRQEVARNVGQRQRINKPPMLVSKRWRIEFNGQVQADIEAPSANEAWARWCDGQKNYPSPHSGGRVITEVV